MLEIVQVTTDSMFRRRRLSLGTSADLLAFASGVTAPTVWLVANDVLPSLAPFSDLIEDRGVKHKAVELSRVLLHGDRITMVDGGFSSPGKLRQSVERFLTNVADSPPRLFIVGTSPEIFARLAEAAAPALPLASPPGSPQERPFDKVQSHMRREQVPDDLRNRYLGESPEVENVRQLILRAAALRCPVLIVGDTGTGKEIVASQIHTRGPRASGPFLPLNCGTFSHTLFESELFGHKKGSFTGAVSDKDGVWKAANKGTLFLDEIGELHLDLQAKVLRALEQNKIRPVGAEQEETVDARVILATNRDLYAMVQAGTFRIDLYYRVRGFLIHTPALREHKEDIPLLAQHLWKKVAGEEAPQLLLPVLDVLSRYNWAGNVRELKMVLTRAHGYFGGSDPLEARHVEAILADEGHETRLQTATTAPSAPQRRFSAFRSLSRTQEAVRATEYLLKPLLRGNSDRSVTNDLVQPLELLLEQIASQCRYPLAFQPDTFESVSLLHTRLSYFLSEFVENPEAALGYLSASCGPSLDEALLRLEQEIGTVLADLK